MTDQIAVIAVIVAVASIIGNFILAGKQVRHSNQRDQFSAIWEKIDELRGMVEETNDSLLKEYMTQDQIREFFKLSSDGWSVKLEHIDRQISDLKELVKEALSAR